MEQERAQEYSDYEKVLADRQKELESRIQQLKLLQKYAGCPHCISLSVDAYSLYENNKLVCQPCLTKEKGRASSPISF